jgi:hypothetical protein
VEDESPSPLPTIVARPSKAWRYKDTVYLGLGSFLLVVGVLGMTAIGSLGDPFHVLWGVVLCSATGVVPGALLLLFGWRARKEEKTLVAFSAWIKTYRRIPLNDLAKNLGKTRFETEQVLATAVDRQLVEGIVDRTTDEFVVRESMGQQIFVEQCPHCGAAIHRWFLPEDRLICAHCNQPILAASAASTKPGPS